MRAWMVLVVLVVLAGCGRKSARSPAAADAEDAAVDAAADAAVACECPSVPEPAPSAPAGDDTLTLTAVGFDDLPDWNQDHQAEAVPAFLASCAKLAELADDAPVGQDGLSGRARAWRPACAAAARVTPGDDAAARAFFQAEFRPYQAAGAKGPEGKFTSYYVESLRGSRTRHGKYQVPIYGKPPDLVMVDLTPFIADGRGRRIWGRLEKGNLVPFPTRGEIRRGALDGQGLEILWVDDKVDALFADIEGSGRVELDDGTTVRIEFAGKNGRQYRGVGGVLKDMGELQRGQGTMQGIRAWFDAHPDRIDEIADKNQSKVFFALSTRPGAVGSQGVILTARRSLAVDRKFVAASTPIWVDTRAPLRGQPRTAPWRTLMIAQDTGGGILGPVRGDIYWGDDEEAADISGRLGGAGRYWLLLPRAVKVPR